MRVWIEIVKPDIVKRPKRFHPLMRVWIEIKELGQYTYDAIVSPSYEGVD